MSVIDGQTGNATNFNSAFVSKTANSSMEGTLTLSNAGSGADVTNVQSDINTTKSDILTAQSDISALQTNSANTDLSNLIPTAINQNLTFAVGTNRVIETPDIDSANSDSLTIITGNATTSGDTGNVEISIGVPDSGTRGKILLTSDLIEILPTGSADLLFNINNSNLNIYTPSPTGGADSSGFNQFTGAADTGGASGSINRTTGSIPSGAGSSGAMVDVTGDTDSVSSGYFTRTTGNSNSGNTGSINETTGNSVSGNSGDYAINIGTAGGTRGKIKFIDGSEGVAGYLWKSSGTGGEGTWSNPTTSLTSSNNNESGTLIELNAITTDVVRLTNASLVSIREIIAGANAQRVILINRTGVNVDISNDDAITSGQDILTGTGAILTLNNNAAILLSYDSITLAWQIVGGSGSGTGSTLKSQFVIWNDVGGASPVASTEYNRPVWLYEAGGANFLYASVKVPLDYIPGSLITMWVLGYSPDSSGTILANATATLIRPAIDAVSSTTNQHTSGETAVTLGAGTVNEYQTFELDLTSSIGEINSVAVLPGHEILVALYRDSDTATSDLRIAEKCEVIFEAL